MPIYAYKCQSCGFAKDVLQKMSDPALESCPSCSAQTFTKQLTAAGFQLKGSGWYVTDFKGGNNNNTTPSPAADTPTETATPKSEAPAPAAAPSPDTGTACAS